MGVVIVRFNRVVNACIIGILSQNTVLSLSVPVFSVGACISIRIAVGVRLGTGSGNIAVLLWTRAPLPSFPQIQTLLSRGVCLCPSFVSG